MSMEMKKEPEMNENAANGGVHDPPNEKRSLVYNIKKWKSRFIYDFTKKELLPVKLLFFLIYGANSALSPFLTLQARSLGITEGEVGTIYSFTPVAALLAPPLAGMIADKIGNFKLFLSLATASTGLAGVLFIVVPVGRITHNLPENLNFSLTCSSLHGNRLERMEQHNCEIIKDINEFPIYIQNCSSTCLETGDLADTFISNLMCGDSADCFHNSAYNYDAGNNTDHNSLVQIFNLGSQNNTHLDTLWKSNYTISILNGSYQVTYDSDKKICPYYSEEDSLHRDERINVTKSRRKCFTQCTVTTSRKNYCSNTKYVEEISSSLTFYSHLVIRLVKSFLSAVCFPLLEGASVVIITELNGDFGFNRLYYNLGLMSMTPISGILIDYASKKAGIEDFSPAMYLYCALNLFAAFVILFLNLEFKQGSNTVLKDFAAMMRDPVVVFFLLATFLAGIFFGFIETFMFWLLEDMGAGKTLMGLTNTIASIFGIPIHLASTYILKRLGHINTVVLGFAAYIARFIGFTIITNPWYVMLVETLESVTMSLMLVAFASYSMEIVSPAIVVTLQGLYIGLYNGLGKGMGSLIGGHLIEAIGIIHTFRVMALAAGASGILYFFANFIIDCCKKFKEIDNNEESNNENNEETVRNK